MSEGLQQFRLVQLSTRLPAGLIKRIVDLKKAEGRTKETMIARVVEAGLEVLENGAKEKGRP